MIGDRISCILCRWDGVDGYFVLGVGDGEERMEDREANSNSYILTSMTHLSLHYTIFRGRLWVACVQQAVSWSLRLVGVVHLGASTFNPTLHVQCSVPNKGQTSPFP